MTVKRYTALSAAAVILLLAACGKKSSRSRKIWLAAIPP